jgi:glycosyltransferase involved in cell wall biosynthesis
MIDSLSAGGAERLVVNVINNLPDYEHHLIILHGPEDLRHEIKAEHFFLNLNKSSHMQMFRLARQVKRYIRENNIDIVHSHLYYSNILARISTPRSVSLFNTLHVISSLDNYTKNKLSLYIDRLTYKQHHHIIAVSHEVLNDFKKWVGVKGPSTVLYNFIDDSFFSKITKTSISKDPFRLVAVGNLRYQKNYFFLVEAFKKMPANVMLDVYGEGPLRETLQKEIDKHKLKIKLLGSQKQINKILPQYDAFIMSSFFEGQPLSLLEAIASGLPALLSDIPVLKEVTGEYAVYFDPNDPADLVQKIKDILDDKICLTKKTELALNRIQSFAKKDIYMEKLEQLYN